MGPPSKSQIKAATEALRREARIWEQQGDQLREIVSQAESLRLSRIEAGVFQVIFGTYSAVLDQIITRSDEGQLRMTEIASTLREAANTYDQEDAANMHFLNNLY